MCRRIIWCYGFLLTFLEISMNAILTAQGKSHDGFLHDTLVDGVTFQEWGKEPANNGGGRPVPAESIRITPATLDFGRAELGVAHALTVTLTNTANTTMHLASVAGTTPDFYASFFESKTLAPQANTTFIVVYLGRQEGFASAHLYLHTSLGVHKYPVSALGVASRWGLWPLSSLHIPHNASLRPSLTMHNPTSHAIQVSEIYSSADWVSLSLCDSNEVHDINGAVSASEMHDANNVHEKGTQEESDTDGSSLDAGAWIVPAGKTRALVRLTLSPQHQNAPATAYIRIKTNATSSPLVVVVEARGAAAGEFAAPLHVRLGHRGSQDPPHTVEILVGSSYPQALSLDGLVLALRCGAECLPAPPPPLHHHNGFSTEGPQLSLLRDYLEPFQPLTKAATVTFDFARLWAERDQTSSCSVSSTEKEANTLRCGGWVRLRRRLLPYSVTLSRGTLRLKLLQPEEQKVFNNTLSFITLDKVKSNEAREIHAHNEFETALHIREVLYGPDIEKYFEIETFTPMTLEAGQSALLARMKLDPHVTSGATLSSVLTVATNLTRYTVPVLLYEGRLTFEWEWGPSGIVKCTESSPLNLGNVLPSATRRVWGRLCNPAPAPVCNVKLQADLRGATLATLDALNDTCISGRSCVRVVLAVVAGSRGGTVGGALRAIAGSERAICPTSLLPSKGTLKATSPVYTMEAAPYVWGVSALTVENTLPSVVSFINHTHPNSQHKLDFIAKGSPEIDPGVRVLGDLIYAPEKLCTPNCYSGLQTDTAEGTSWLERSWQLNSESLQLDAVLYQQRKALFLQQTNQLNLTLYLHSTEVLQIPVSSSVRLVWPSLGGATMIQAGAAPVAEQTIFRVQLDNPSRSHVLLLQPYLHHRNVIDLELPLCSNEHCVWSSDAFSLSSWSATKGNVSLYRTQTQTEQMPMLRLEPGAQVTLDLNFNPNEEALLSTFLYLRNNLTILETIQIAGRGAYPQFEISPNTSPIVLEATECREGSALAKKYLRLRNTGQVKLTIHLNLQRDRGFRLSTCGPIHLMPNESGPLFIEYSHDRTLARSKARLEISAGTRTRTAVRLWGSTGTSVTGQCGSRPPWERGARAAAAGLALLGAVLVLAAAHLDAERAPAARGSGRGTPLDLRSEGMAARSTVNPTVPPPPNVPSRVATTTRRKQRASRRTHHVVSDPKAERQAFEAWRDRMLRGDSMACNGDDSSSRSSDDQDSNTLQEELCPSLNDVDVDLCKRDSRYSVTRDDEAESPRIVNNKTPPICTDVSEPPTEEEVQEEQSDEQQEGYDLEEEEPILDKSPEHSPTPPRRRSPPPAPTPTTHSHIQTPIHANVNGNNLNKERTHNASPKNRPVKLHLRKVLPVKRRSAVLSSRSVGTATPPAPAAAAPRPRPATWSAVVATRPLPAPLASLTHTAHHPLPPIGSDRRVEPDRSEINPAPLPSNTGDQSLFYFSGNDAAWRAPRPPQRYLAPTHLAEDTSVNSETYNNCVWGNGLGVASWGWGGANMNGLGGGTNMNGMSSGSNMNGMGSGSNMNGMGSGSSMNGLGGVNMPNIPSNMPNMPNLGGNMPNLAGNMSNLAGNMSNISGNMNNMGVGNMVRPPPGFPAPLRPFDPFRSLSSIWAPTQSQNTNQAPSREWPNNSTQHHNDE